MGLISAQYAFRLSGVEEITVGVDGAVSDKRRITYDAFNNSGNFTPETNIVGEEIISTKFGLTTGALTIDLSLIVGANGREYDMTGKALQAIHIRNLGENAMTFEEGASDGYDILSSIVVPAGGQVMLHFNGGLANVGASANTIDVTGTGSQEFAATMIFGEVE